MAVSLLVITWLSDTPIASHPSLKSLIPFSMPYALYKFGLNVPQGPIEFPFAERMLI